jgi:fatty acid desaturase
MLTIEQVLGHEAGHSAFSPSDVVNNTAGFLYHSFLLTPYFAWRSSHRRHHTYANNQAKDYHYVPPTREEYMESFTNRLQKIDDVAEDSPIYTLGRILVQQVLGWPMYLITNITAGPASLARPEKKSFVNVSHFSPFSAVFRPEEWHLIVASDIGIGAMMALLWYAAQHVGWQTVALLYIQPYVWVNHWIVAITYLHHTHPKLPKYDNEAWSFIKGATATVDRDSAMWGEHLTHNITEYHVIHHLFP